MNKIYKVIWSKAKHTYVVASEIAKGHTKGETTGKGLKRLAAALLVAAALLSPNFAWAADTTKVEPAPDGSATAVEVYTKEEANNAFATIENVSTLGHTVNTLSSELDTLSTLVNTLQSSTAKVDADGKVAKAVAADSAESATKAEQDGAGNVIISTYATKTEVSQKADASTVTDEASAREAGDKTLNDRITAVKEHVLKETGDNYVSKADAAVQDAGVVKADKKIGENVTALGKGLYDETAARIGADAAQDKVIKQVNDNLVASVNTINKNVADGFTALNQAGANEAAAREAKDNELNERITNEANAIHDEIKAGDKVLDDRITNVKEYLEKQTSDNYVSKADAAVQDGAVVKAANTIGENVTNLDAALAKETAARLGADKAQDKVIEQVNQNMVDGFNTINKNMSDGFTALSQADANELAGRMAADTKLVEATNGGLSLDNDNVLQKTKTKISSTGEVTTSKEAATTLILNKGAANQVKIDSEGVTVGTSSTQMDAEGFTAGGHDYDAAGAALMSDGRIKGANGDFTVDTDGNVASGNVTSTGTVKGKTLTDGAGASMSGGTVTGTTLTDGKATISNGNIKTNGGFIQTGGGNVNTQGGEVRTNGGKVATSGGEINTGSGAIKTVGGDILTAGGKLNTSGGNIVAGTGDISGHNITASGVLSGDSLTVANGMTGRSLTLTGGDLDAGAGTIKTTGEVDAGTLNVRGKATVKDLEVKGEFKAETLTSKLDENNYTTINGGNVTSVNSKVSVDDARTYTSTSNLTEKGRTDTAADGTTTNVSVMTAGGSDSTISSLADKNQKSYITQNLKKILQGIQNGDNATTVDQAETGIKSTATDGKNTASTNLSNKGFNTYATDGTNRTYTLQTAESLTSQIGDDGKVKSVMKADGITNNADGGTITNSAKDLVNKATGDMTNTVGGKLLNDVTGDMENKVGGNLTTTVSGTSTETVTGKKTENYNGGLETTVTGDEKHAITGSQTNTIGGSQTTTVTGDSSLKAENITNEAKNKITNKALDVETDAASSIVSKVSNEYGSNTSTQLSYETKEEMSQADGKIASYLRGAAEEKSQLTDGDKKTTVDTIAGQTNTNITDGTNTSNDLQKADQIASSVTDGTNTTVVNQNAKSLASSITDGTKANNTNNTVDKSEQLIKASDTQYSATSKTATKMEDALVSGSSIIDVIKNLDDAANPLISSAVTDGTNNTGVTQTAKDITNAAQNGTITNEAKDLVNTASENMTNNVGKDLTTTVGGEMKTTVTGDVTEDYKANLSTTVGGNQTTTVTGDSSLKAENITNEAKNKIINKAIDVETDAASSIVSKVSNDAGSNTSTQLSYQTTEEMKADGKTASYLRGAAEEKSQLIDGSKKTTIDTVAGQTNTNITEGTNVSNSLQKADQIASSVTDGTNTTVVNQDAKSLASSITDGAKANNTNNTVDKSEQLIKADDTRYYAETKTAGSAVEALKSDGNTIISAKDAVTGTVSSVVTDGTNTTGSTMTAKGITNSAAESIVNEIGDGSAVKSEMTADGITNTAKGGTIYNKSKNILNEASGDILNFADGEIGNSATKITNLTGDNTVTSDTNGTTFENKAHSTAVKEGTITKTTISGNTLETGKATMDYAEVMKDLGVRGNAAVDGNTILGKEGAETTLTVNSKSTFKDTVKMEKTLEVDGTSTFNDKVTVTKGGLDVTGGTTTDTLHVTSTSTFDGTATFKDIVTMEKDLSVGGNATVAGNVTAKSYKVGDKTYIDENGINANSHKITNVAAGELSANSMDAVNGSQLYETNTRVSGLETRMGTVETKVDKLDGKIDKVGANAAAMANLHPLEFDEDSKWNIAAAVGSSGSETASAVGVFYRPNENVMVNASAAMGTGENMFGGGVSLRLGHGGNKAKEAQMKAAAAENKELRAKVDDLTARMDALLSVLNPNMSKDFPDVPENHWAYEAVSRLAGNGIVEGYEDGKYHGERQMTRYEMAEIIYNALSKGAKAEKKLVEEFRPELQAMAAQKKA
ncbi:ESPR-type extended signal peptide-containing protein [uncultured Dialister sp.]|uniref:ESPR-type extended signal peptide-containing protein n=1 Tax=uncultured Dialister sp. TaxID=278064 RepID=UPI0025EC3316|nr:ESPR-type extended signal peptide-containing protein [uncultured Dialister sp.]